MSNKELKEADVTLAPIRKSTVRPLDLSNLLKHAFSAGYTSAAGDDGWTDYDPTTCPTFERIRSALQTGGEIERLTARVAELEGALRPFANDASAWADFDGCEPLIELWPGGPESALQVSDLRDAKAALEPKP